jgi:hypothetical protein
LALLLLPLALFALALPLLVLPLARLALLFLLLALLATLVGHGSLPVWNALEAPDGNRP